MTLDDAIKTAEEQIAIYLERKPLETRLLKRRQRMAVQKVIFEAILDCEDNGEAERAEELSQLLGRWDEQRALR
jgi:hypothetical protein